jgi:predicted RNA methylase
MEIVEDTVRVQPDMELVDLGDGNDLLTAIKGRQADVVVAAERDGDPPGLRDQLLVENPHLKVFVVTEDGREARLLEFRQVPVPEVSPQGLIDAIRAAVGGTS